MLESTKAAELSVAEVEALVQGYTEAEDKVRYLMGLDGLQNEALRMESTVDSLFLARAITLRRNNIFSPEVPEAEDYEDEIYHLRGEINSQRLTIEFN